MDNYVTQLGSHLSISRYFFASQFVRGKVVLELGSGYGNGCNFMVNKGALAVIGGDIDLKLIEYATTNYHQDNLYFSILDAVQLPFRSGSVDVITAFEIIEHLERQEDFLRECARVLKKGGLLLCSTPNREVFSAGDTPWYPDHVREFTIADFHETLSENFSQPLLYGIYPAYAYGQKERALDKAINRRKGKVESFLISSLARYKLLKVVNSIIWLVAPQFRSLKRKDFDREFKKTLAHEYQPYLLREGAEPPLDMIAIATVV